MHSKQALVFLVFTRCALIATQFTFEDSGDCEKPSENCVLLSECRDQDATQNAICDFHGSNPLVCCRDIIEQSTKRPASPSTSIPSPASTRTPDSTTPLPSTTMSSENEPTESESIGLPKDCGRSPNHFFNRIVGGESAKDGAWPWLAVLFIDEEAECGGCLISEKWILTASHCVYEDNLATKIYTPSRIKVLLGTNNLSSSNMFISVTKLIPHPKYGSTRNYANDIALLKLGYKVNLDGRSPFGDRLKPICLPGATSDYGDPTRTNMTNRMAFVAGWGRTNQGDRKSSDVLLQTQLPIWEDRECLDFYRKIFSITNTSFCAGAREGGRDACQGDSGGPLMLPGLDEAQERFYAVGVVSFGIGCGRPGYPGGYTKVSLYRAWIEQQIKLN